VTLGQDVAAALPFLRREAESRMSETFRIFDETFVTDPENDLREIPVESVIYEGPGRLAFRSSVVSDVNVASQLVAVQGARVDVPLTVSGVSADSVVVVTGSSSDAGLVGRRFRVEGLPAAGQVTAHRYQVVEVT
jgi:hypothetical protein